MRKEFLGRGWKFPFQFDPASGSVAFSEFEQNIKESISVILATKQGERQMLPDFGCRLHELMFAPANEATATLAQFYVQKALERWEPRIEIIQVQAWPDLNGPMRVQVQYKIRATNQQQQLALALNSGG